MINTSEFRTKRSVSVQDISKLPEIHICRRNGSESLSKFSVAERPSLVIVIVVFM